MMRWGGIFADFYRWREGVGPRDKRPPMLNLLWGGVESNQVGTTEFVGLCRTVGAEPLICVNFESDGRQQYMKAKGSVRTADASEAAAWVAYCNAPGTRAHRLMATSTLAFESGKSATNVLRQPGFDRETAREDRRFATAMRKVVRRFN